MWSLISNASFVVQLVMLLIPVAASVTSWILIFQRGNMLRAAAIAGRLRRALLVGHRPVQAVSRAGSNPDPDSGVEQIFRAGFKEFSRLRQQQGVNRMP